MLEKIDIKSLKKYLATRKPGVVEQRKIAKIVKEKINTSSLFSYIEALAKSENWIYREFASCLIPYSFYRDKKEETKKLILKLANDVDWRVRENVTWALFKLLEGNFAELYPLLQEWAINGSKKVRRAVIIAVMRMAKHRDEKLAIPLFELIEHSFADEDEYIQKALAFAIGDGFIRYYPTYSFARLERWAKKNNIRIRQLIARSLSTAGAAKNIQNALEILKQLARKSNKETQNAVIKALLGLAKEKPNEVYSEIKTWQDNLNQRYVIDKVMQAITK